MSDDEAASEMRGWSWNDDPANNDRFLEDMMQEVMERKLRFNCQISVSENRQGQGAEGGGGG